MDKLNKMFKMQYGLQQKLNVWSRINKSDKQWQNYVNQMVLALHEESIEIMRETAYKNPKYVPFGWKKHQLINKNKMKEEIIDLFHFVINLSIASGMDADEFYNIYIGKHRINHNRQKEGY